MRTIRQAPRFRREYKQARAGIYRTALDQDFPSIVELLANDLPLPAARRDHALTGNLTGYRDCHVRGDLVLIYRKVGNDLLELAHLGTHSQLDL